jgi:hypothetical protein
MLHSGFIIITKWVTPISIKYSVNQSDNVKSLFSSIGTKPAGAMKLCVAGKNSVRRAMLCKSISDIILIDTMGLGIHKFIVANLSKTYLAQ